MVCETKGQEIVQLLVGEGGVVESMTVGVGLKCSFTWWKLSNEPSDFEPVVFGGTKNE